QALPELGADLERGTPGVLDAVHLKRETDVPEAVDRGRTVVLAMTVLVASRGQLHRLPLPLQDWIVVEVPALDALADGDGRVAVAGMQHLTLALFRDDVDLLLLDQRHL